jgi:hypothetical protein
MPFRISAQKLWIVLLLHTTFLLGPSRILRHSLKVNCVSGFQKEISELILLMCLTVSPAVHRLCVRLLQLVAQREDEVQHGAAPHLDVSTQCLQLLLQPGNAAGSSMGGMVLNITQVFVPAGNAAG